MSKDEALKLALEALEQLHGIDTETECVTIDVGDVIDAIKEALAPTSTQCEVQGEQSSSQEPVALVVSTAPDRIWLDLGFDLQDEYEVIFHELHDVTWSQDNASGNGIEYVRADTAPPQRPWVGLTDDERNAIEDATLGLHGIPIFFATAIEAKLKEKNT